MSMTTIGDSQRLPISVSSRHSRLSRPTIFSSFRFRAQKAALPRAAQFASPRRGKSINARCTFIILCRQKAGQKSTHAGTYIHWNKHKPATDYFSHVAHTASVSTTPSSLQRCFILPQHEQSAEFVTRKHIFISTTQNTDEIKSSVLQCRA